MQHAARNVPPAAAMLLATAFCGGCQQSAPAAPAQGVRTLGCDDAYSIDTPLGRIANNAWNRPAAGEYPFEQCILVRDASGGAEYGWSWDAPPAGDTLVSFPQVVLGWKPWNGGTSSHSGLPVRIADLASLRLTYTLETRATGKYNQATTLWVTRTGAVGEAPDPADIAADVMIWSDGFAFDPFGMRVGHVNIDGADFDIWFAPDLGDPSGDGPRWNYVAYRHTEKRRIVALDLKKILEHAAAAGFISVDHYVSNVEVGNEVMSGDGETWIKAISLEIARR